MWLVHAHTHAHAPLKNIKTFTIQPRLPHLSFTVMSDCSLLSPPSSFSHRWFMKVPLKKKRPLESTIRQVHNPRPKRNRNSQRPVIFCKSVLFRSTWRGRGCEKQINTTVSKADIMDLYLLMLRGELPHLSPPSLVLPWTHCCLESNPWPPTVLQNVCQQLQADSIFKQAFHTDATSTYQFKKYVVFYYQDVCILSSSGDCYVEKKIWKSNTFYAICIFANILTLCNHCPWLLCLQIIFQ